MYCLKKLLNKIFLFANFIYSTEQLYLINTFSTCSLIPQLNLLTRQILTLLTERQKYYLTILCKLFFKCAFDLTLSNSKAAVSVRDNNRFGFWHRNIPLAKGMNGNPITVDWMILPRLVANLRNQVYIRTGRCCGQESLMHYSHQTGYHIHHTYIAYTTDAYTILALTRQLTSVFVIE